MDSIRLSGIRAVPSQPSHGERFTYMVDAVLYLDLSEAERLDDPTHTVDYVQVAHRITSLIQHEPFGLLETLTAKVAHAILLSHQVRRTRVTVTRLGADTGMGVDFDVSVTLDRAADGEEVTSASQVSAAQACDSSRREEAAVGPAGHPALVRNTYDEYPDSARNRRPRQVLAGEGVERSFGQAGATHHAVVSMTGNLGDVKRAMYEAVVSMDGIPGSQIEGISPLYSLHTTEPTDYLCAVVILETKLAPHNLLSGLQMIESAHGRSHRIRWGSYPLDLDIVDYDGIELDEGDLRLPHILAGRRAEVLAPWKDLEPDAVLPGNDGGPIGLLLEQAPDINALRKVSDDWIVGGAA